MIGNIHTHTNVYQGVNRLLFFSYKADKIEDEKLEKMIDIKGEDVV